MNLFSLVKAPKNKHELPYLRRKYYNGVISLVHCYNRVAQFIFGNKIEVSGSPELDEIRQRALTRTDINDHLETLFLESLAVRPKLIVELGIRHGESTFVLERVAKMCHARLVSVDREQNASAASSWEDWMFVCGDDVEFGSHFGQWTHSRSIDSHIDVLFIDTSHEYDHTLRELACWLPFLSDHAKVFLHDTNNVPLYRRCDHSIGIASDIHRGVMRALEKYFDTRFDERHNFIRFHQQWLITHHAGCNGFTILQKT